MAAPDLAGPETQPLRAASEQVIAGRYRVLARLGSGGMAEVFRAHDELLDRDVAVKVFRTAPDPSGDGHAELRRELELQSLAQLNHPNLITLFDGSLSADGPGYLVLELVDGPDLATRLHAGPLPEPEARQVAIQIADALGYVHARGMVHRDVKPANILLGTDSGRPDMVRARLSDFGIVRMVGSARVTAADLTLGTASYVAPEQARGGNVEPPADIYSLGLVLIEALTGSRCFDGPLHEALAARLTTSPLIPTTLPDPWPGLLKAMTETEPGQRPTAAEVVETLTSGRQLPPFDAGPPPPSPEWYPVEERSHRGLWLLLAVVAFAAIIAGGGYFLLAGHANTPPPVSPGNTPEPHVSTAATTHKHHASASRTAGGAVQPVPHRTARPAHRTATHAVAPSQQTATTPATSPTPTSTPTSPSPSPPPSTSNPPTTSPPPTP